MVKDDVDTAFGQKLQKHVIWALLIEQEIML